MTVGGASAEVAPARQRGAGVGHRVLDDVGRGDRGLQRWTRRAGLDQLFQQVGAVCEVLKPLSKPTLEPRVDAVSAEDIRKALRHHAADFTRWREVERRGRRLAGSLALALAAPLSLLCGLLLGLLVQTQFDVLTAPDPTGGWKDHVWRHHGQAHVDCTARARAVGASVTCPLTIEAP